MPGKRSPIATNTHLSKAARRRKAKNRKTYRELVELASDGAGLLPADLTGLSPIDVMDEVLGRAIMAMRFAATQAEKLKEDELWVDRIDAQGNVLVEPNKWIQLEGRMREEAFDYAFRMEGLGIQERRNVVAERLVTLMLAAFEAAARDAKIKPAQRKALGAGLRTHLAVLEGGNERDPIAA